MENKFRVDVSSSPIVVSSSSVSRDTLIKRYKIAMMVTVAQIAPVAICVALAVMYSNSIAVWVLVPLIIVFAIGMMAGGFFMVSLASSIRSMDRRSFIGRGRAQDHGNLECAQYARGLSAQLPVVLTALHTRNGNLEREERPFASERICLGGPPLKAETKVKSAPSTTEKGCTTTVSQLFNGDLGQEEPGERPSKTGGLKRMFVPSCKSKTDVLSRANLDDRRLLPADSSVQGEQQIEKLPKHHSLKCIFTFSLGSKANIVTSVLRDVTAFASRERAGLIDEKYFHKLILTPIPKDKVGEWFAQEHMKYSHKILRGYGGTLNLPHFLWSDKQQKYCLCVDDELFDYRLGSLLRDVRHNFEQWPSSLSVRPLFFRGVRVQGVIEPSEQYRGFPFYPGFPSGLQYCVTYNKLLDGPTIMEIMLGSHLQGNEKLLKFSGELLSGYVALKRQQLQEFTGGCGALSNSDEMLRDDIERFFRCQEGLRFAKDLTEYGGPFDAIGAEKSPIPALREDIEFIASVRNILSNMMKRDPDVRAKILAHEGTSDDVLRVLYGLTSPYMQFLNHDLSRNLLSRASSGYEDLIAYFLVDSDLREMLVSRAIKWALLAVDEYADELDVDSVQLLLFKAATQNCVSNNNPLPMACVTIPGLIEAAVCIAQIFRGGDKEIIEWIPLRYLKQMHLVPGFPVYAPIYGPTEGEVRRFNNAHRLFIQRSEGNNVPSYARPLIMAEAILRARKVENAPAEKEDCLLDQMYQFLRENNNEHDMSPSLEECATRVRLQLDSMKMAALNDRQSSHIVYIQELVTCTIANTIRELLGNKKCSITGLKEIARSMPERMGSLLAKRGSKVHKLLNDTMLCNNTEVQYFIPACIMNIDVSPALQYLAGVLKLGDLKRPRQCVAPDDCFDDRKPPPSGVSDLSHIVSQVQVDQQQSVSVV
ncbi:MAG: hypothetical protein ACTJLL_02035 [Anaplasma sp.]